MVAVTAKSCVFPKHEWAEAEAFCQKEQIPLYSFEAEVLAVDGFTDNPPDRCYRCKKALFEEILHIARTHGIAHVIEGSNMDDLGDYRPGMQAIAELGIKSPLREAGLYKQEIRELSREYGLPTWEKAVLCMPCIALCVRGDDHKRKLRMVEQAEQF